MMKFFEKIIHKNNQEEKDDYALTREEDIKEEKDLISTLLPRELLESLQIRELNQMQTGVQKYISSVVMTLNTTEFAALMHQFKTKDMFLFINKILNRVVPEVYAYHGVIDKFSGGGLVAYYYDEYEHSVISAISIIETINDLSYQGEGYKQYSIGLTYGSVMVGVVGHERRMSVLTISEFTGLSDFLHQIGPKYYARILITGTLVKKIPEFFKKFNSRFLGYLYLTETKMLEEVYDVFDGDYIEVRNLKRKTRIPFEKGVNLYAKGQYSSARMYFIEVLKIDPNDKATKEYLFLCDRQMGTEANDSQVYIESY